VELAAAGGSAVMRDLSGKHGAGIYVGLVAPGWATIDRGTPNNIGGFPPDFIYTLTSSGWSAARICSACKQGAEVGPRTGKCAPCAKRKTP
jgi:hypothetical protein